MLLRRGRQILATIFLIGVAVLISSVVVTEGGAARGAESPTEAAAVATEVNSVLPGSTATLVPDQFVPTGLDLEITTPASSVAVPGSQFSDLAATTTSTATTVSYGELGWKAALAAGDVGIADPNIIGYAVVVAGASPTSEQQNFLSSPIRAMPGGPERSSFSAIGTISLSDLTAQMNSNVRTLEGALGAGTVTAAHVVPVPVDSATGAYALEVDLAVTNLSALTAHTSDIMNGLETGLVGDDGAPAEGVAINIVDAHGNRASWWSAVRSGNGSAVVDPPLSLNQSEDETTTFPNLTGGPAFSGFGAAS